MVFEHAVIHNGKFYWPGENVPIENDAPAKEDSAESEVLMGKLAEEFENAEKAIKRGRPRRKKQ